MFAHRPLQFWDEQLKKLKFLVASKIFRIFASSNKKQRIKSIKEKAHEIGLVYSKHYGPIACKQEWCEMAAREGANYVIDIVEKELPLENNKNLNDYGKALVWRLKNCIEQLKK